MNPKKLLFPTLAFLIPLLVRVVPEILMGPYLVGFDTISHYVPTTILWLNGNVTPWSFIGTAPILYIVTAGLTLVSGSVTIALKVLPPVLLGFLGLSIYLYAKRGLSWSPKKSLVPALVGTLYFVALRVSWDALREEIAIIFLFLALTSMAYLGRKDFSWKHYLLFSVLLTAIVLSNQVVAVLALGIVLFTVVYKLLRESRVNALRLVAFSVPAVAFFLATFYLSPAIPEYRLILGFPSTPDGWLSLFGYSSYQGMLWSELVFVLYCFVLLVPLAVLSIRHFRSVQMRSWVLLILLAAFIPLVSPSGMRLLMLLVYPLAFYAADGLSLLKNVRWSRFSKPLFGVGMAYLAAITVILSVGFMVMPPETPFPYFAPGGLNSNIYQIPSSMLQNSVSISDCQGVTDAVQWVKTHMDENSLLLSHRAFYGWTLPTIGADHILMYEYDNPADVAGNLTASYSHVYLIWWVAGKGWYGLSSVPSVFHEVYQSGNIAVYVYAPA